MKYSVRAEIRGAFMLTGLIIGSIVLYHFFGWIGTASLWAVFCFWRAA